MYIRWLLIIAKFVVNCCHTCQTWCHRSRKEGSV